LDHKDLQERRVCRECLEDQEVLVPPVKRVNQATPLQKRVHQALLEEMESLVCQEVQAQQVHQGSQDSQVFQVQRVTRVFQVLAYLDRLDPKDSLELPEHPVDLALQDDLVWTDSQEPQEDLDQRENQASVCPALKDLLDSQVEKDFQAPREILVSPETQEDLAVLG